MGAVWPRMRAPAGATEPVTRLDLLRIYEDSDTRRWTTRNLTTLNNWVRWSPAGPDTAHRVHLLPEGGEPVRERGSRGGAVDRRLKQNPLYKSKTHREGHNGTPSVRDFRNWTYVQRFGRLPDPYFVVSATQLPGGAGVDGSGKNTRVRWHVGNGCQSASSGQSATTTRSASWRMSGSVVANWPAITCGTRARTAARSGSTG